MNCQPLKCQYATLRTGTRTNRAFTNRAPWSNCQKSELKAPSFQMAHQPSAGLLNARRGTLRLLLLNTELGGNRSWEASFNNCKFSSSVLNICSLSSILLCPQKQLSYLKHDIPASSPSAGHHQDSRFCKATFLTWQIKKNPPLNRRALK